MNDAFFSVAGQGPAGARLVVLDVRCRRMRSFVIAYMDYRHPTLINSSTTLTTRGDNGSRMPVWPLVPCLD